MGIDITSVAANIASSSELNQLKGADRKSSAVLAAAAAAQVLQNRVQQAQQATGVQLP